MLFEYFKLECKRILQLFPKILVVNAVIIMLLIGAVAAYNSGMFTTKDKVSGMKVGMVFGENDRQFIEFGLYFLEHTDEIKYVCKFVEVSEEKGRKMLEKEEIDALIIVPENYVTSVYYGEEEPLTLCFGTAQSGISSLLLGQLSDAISEYMMQAKAGVYAMQDMYDSWHLKYSSDADELTARFMMKIFDRKGMINVQTVSSTGTENPVIYYITAGFVLLLFMWGLNCGSVFGKNEEVMQQLLKRRGLSQSKQFLGKYGAVFILFFLNYLLIAHAFGVMAVVFSKYSVQIDIESAAKEIKYIKQLVDIMMADGIGIFIKITPVLLLVSSFVICIYEAFNDGINGMLFIFLSVVIMAFLAGFFYPASYFPMWVQRAGKWLPTGIILEYITHCIMGDKIINCLIKVVIYSGIFAVIYRILLLYKCSKLYNLTDFTGRVSGGLE